MAADFDKVEPLVKEIVKFYADVIQNLIKDRDLK